MKGPNYFKYFSLHKWQNCLLEGSLNPHSSSHHTHTHTQTSISLQIHMHKCTFHTLTIYCCCSAAKLCLTPCNPMDCTMTGLPVLHCIPEFAQTISIESVMLSNHFILCHCLLFLHSLFPSLMVFATELALCISCPTWALILPMNIQGWFPLELTDLIPLLPKGFSRVFSSNTIQKQHFFSTQPLWFNSHIHTWLLEKS